MSTLQPGQMAIDLPATSLLADVLHGCGQGTAYTVLKLAEETAAAAGRDSITAADLRAAMVQVADDIRCVLAKMPPESEGE